MPNKASLFPLPLLAILTVGCTCLAAGAEPTNTTRTAWLNTWRAANPVWRGVHLSAQSDSQAAQLLEALPKLAEAGVNVVIVETDYSFEFHSHPELRPERFVTTARAHELSQAAHAHG